MGGPAWITHTGDTLHTLTHTHTHTLFSPPPPSLPRMTHCTPTQGSPEAVKALLVGAEGGDSGPGAHAFPAWYSATYEALARRWGS